MQEPVSNRLLPGLHRWVRRAAPRAGQSTRLLRGGVPGVGRGLRSNDTCTTARGSAVWTATRCSATVAISANLVLLNGASDA